MRDHHLFIPQCDLPAAAAVLLALCVGVWFGWLHSDSAAQRLAELRNRQIDLQTEHAKLQKELQRNEALWKKLEEGARREGNIDNQEPVQARLRAVRGMAQRHGWNEVVIMPVHSRRQADVSEQTFRVTAVAGFQDILSFMREFEGSNAWADVSHLSLRSVPQQLPEDRDRCSVEITLNLYSSYVRDRQRRASPDQT